MFSYLRPSNTPKPAPLALGDAISRAAAGSLTLLDVREVSELAKTGRAKGALHLPLAALAARCPGDLPKGLDPAKPVAVYCASGMRSGQATQILRDAGFGEVHNIGGFSAWQSAGGPVSA